MIVKRLTEHHLEFLSLNGGCTDSSESTLVKTPHCLKSDAGSLLYGLCLYFDSNKCCNERLQENTQEREREREREIERKQWKKK